MFEFVDLFAGIGGFHAALSKMGGTGVQAVELDKRAAAVYKLNWRLDAEGDVRDLAADPSLVRDHAVLAGGFPCQPFSKSGRQLGMTEERGTVFHDVVTILESKRPPLVLLENVRNLAGPRQRDAWSAVLEGLRRAGYALSDQPMVFSPHLLPHEAGGAPQVRERMYIIAVFVGPDRSHEISRDLRPVLASRPVAAWDPQNWRIKSDVMAKAADVVDLTPYGLSKEEQAWLDAWNRLLKALPARTRLPGHPLWADVWRGHIVPRPGDPDWKLDFIDKNIRFMADNPQVARWVENTPLEKFPASRRKLEWQAQDSPRDLTNLLVQMRPSGIRVKKATYAPALVAMAQTSMFHDGHRMRRMTVPEAAVLQGLPDGFTFGDQPHGLSYRQLGNAVNVGAMQYVLARYVLAHRELLEGAADAGARVSGQGVVDAVEKWWAARGLEWTVASS